MSPSFSFDNWFPVRSEEGEYLGQNQHAADPGNYQQRPAEFGEILEFQLGEQHHGLVSSGCDRRQIGTSGADGDGQHNARYILPMLRKMQEGNYDIVIGSRFLHKKKGHSLRMMGSRIISAIFRLTTGKRFTDPTSGMRLVNRKIMRQIAFDMNCGAEPDTWAYFVRNGARFIEVQVEMNEREAGTSYFTLMSSIRYMLRMFVSISFINLFRRRREEAI